MTDIIVFHTAWMAQYDGDRSSFSAGGFKYAKEHGYGHEMFNFRKIEGACYGYTSHQLVTSVSKNISASLEMPTRSMV